MGEEGRITIEDVEIAIKVIATWLREQERVNVLLQRISSRYTGYVYGQNQSILGLLNMIKTTKEEVEEGEDTVSPEELKEFRERIKLKVKKE